MTAKAPYFDATSVKAAARGRWREILAAAGIPLELLDGRHHGCPKCDGIDRFRFIDREAGAVLCNQCFRKGNGDGLAAIRWIRGCDFPTAVRFVAEHLGLAPQHGHRGHAADSLDLVCRIKRMPMESALAFGARGENGAAVFPSWGPDGRPASDFTIWPTGSAKQLKGKWPKGGNAGVFLPLNPDGMPRLPQPGETWLVVEGVKDAATLHGLGYLAVGLHSSQMAQKFVAIFHDVHVVLVPDRDTSGVDGAEASARRLFGVATSIRIAALPADLLPKSGKDVRDILAQENGEARLREAISRAANWRRPGNDDRSVDNRIPVYAGPRQHEVADQAIAALAGLNGLYQRGCNLVSIVRDAEPPKGIVRPPGNSYLAPIDEPGLCDRLSQVVRFFKQQKGDEVEVPPQQRIAKIILSRRQWPGVPVVEGIVHAPVFLPDGSILTTPGFSQVTGLYLEARCDFPSVPQAPTKADAQHARDELLEVVCDFPFATPAHKAAWLALAITPAARFAIDGPVPLGAFDANVRGSGKSKLADSIGMIHLGTDLPRTCWSGSDEEFRKQATAVLLAGERIMLIDNISGMLGCSSLDALLTATTWNDRILKESKMTGPIPATTMWLASGNNLVFAADTARRVLTCRLEAREENPEEREGFRHPELLAWVKANRGRLAVAAVTILRAYHVAGRPRMNLTEWGSYEGWSNLVRSSVLWLGMEDPGATRLQVREQSDREAGLLRQLLAAWQDADPAGTGMTASEAIARAAGGHLLLQDVFGELGTRGKPPGTRSIGMKLHHFCGRVVGGQCFERGPGPNHTTVWRVRAAAAPSNQNQGTKGAEGTISSSRT